MGKPERTKGPSASPKVPPIGDKAATDQSTDSKMQAAGMATDGDVSRGMGLNIVARSREVRTKQHVAGRVPSPGRERAKV